MTQTNVFYVEDELRNQLGPSSVKLMSSLARYTRYTFNYLDLVLLFIEEDLHNSVIWDVLGMV